YRSLDEVLDAREHLRQETDKWQHVATFFARLEQDVELAEPRPVRTMSGIASAWQGYADPMSEPRLELSRFASADGVDSPRRIAYSMNDRHEIELWLGRGLDVAPNVQPMRYPVLRGVTLFELQYLNAARNWLTRWPSTADAPPIPRAVQVRVVLAS